MQIESGCRYEIRQLFLLKNPSENDIIDPYLRSADPEGEFCLLNSLFTWFYCLPMGNAVLLVVGCSLLYLLFAYIIKDRWIRYPIHISFLTAWACVVIYMNVLMRQSSPGHGVDLIPFHSYYVVIDGGNRELLRSNLMNVLLFVPGGLLGACLMPQRWGKWMSVLVVCVGFAAFSAGIEFVQYQKMLGNCEMDDVIHNTFGAVTGTMSVWLLMKFRK